MFTRILTFVIGLPIVLGAVILGLQWLLILNCIIALVGYFEIRQLLTRINVNARLIPGSILTVLLVANGYLGNLFLLEIVCLALGISAVLFIHQPFTKTLVSDLLATMSTPFILGIPFSIVLLMRSGEGGVSWVLLVLFVTFATDTAAYLVGKVLGRRPMAPKISPSKTWEGAIAGLIGGLFIGSFWGVFSDLHLAVWQATSFSLALGVSGQIGDLIESAFKRVVGVKDSGWLVPGHGGILDRVDSVALNIVVAYYLIKLISF